MTVKETKQFQTEVKQILDMMINSLYSHKEIFLRELISNASDALDKVRFEEITHPQFAVADKHIRLTPNKELNTLTISDNGIGMSYDELVQNIGTIAYSGTKAFAKKAQELKDKPELIGQFGVGFYSAFMVADKVTIHTQRAGASEGALWESDGSGTYTIEKKERPEGAGTSITLHLKAVDKEDDRSDDSSKDYTDEWTLKSIVKKYSDFIQFPIHMETIKTDFERDENGKIIEDKTTVTTEDTVLNSQKAMWLRPAKEIKEEEYQEFYKHLTNDWTPPLDTIHYKAEGSHEFIGLLYIPKTQPMDYNQRDMKFGLNLYANRVFITGNCESLVPTYLRFLKGLVDSSDLPLNVSREMIQKDKQIETIKKAITAKVIRHLGLILKNERTKYEEFWSKFGSTLKEGIPTDFMNKDKLVELTLFNSNKEDKLTTLDEYVSRMKADQKSIYFITGDSLSQIANSPYLEKLKKKDFEVLFLVDPVDEWVMNTLHDFKEKSVISITSENLDLDSEDEKKQKEAEIKSAEEKYKPLCESMKKALEESIKEVKVSDRLVDSPVCLVSGSNDPSAHMERLMEKMGQGGLGGKSKRILEINPSHPIFEKMLDMDDEKKTLWAEILYNQALISEGSPIKDPQKFTKQLSDLMVSAR